MSMPNELQEGIYFRARPPIGNSFCIISLRGENITQIHELGVIIAKLWKILGKLKSGTIEGMDVDLRHRKSGNLSVLIGYGNKLFDIKGSLRQKPADFQNNWNFNPPDLGGGGEIVDRTSITYPTSVSSNHLLTDHVVLQLIAENEFFTNRAAVEIWKQINRLEQTSRSSCQLRITGFYTGFQRADKRNWLGFHDGVSNIKSQERSHVISIGPRYLNPRDQWTLNGTYLAFMRITVDLEKWEKIPITAQEVLVGRDKLTGCPIVRLDSAGKPVKDPRCPVSGTSEVIDRGNEYFREYPPYRSGTKEKSLRTDHITQVRPIDGVPIWDKKSSRIYRQGFEFLTSSIDNARLVTGLNFVSFQNTPERLFKALEYQQTNMQKTDCSDNLNNYMSVLAAGIFFVPPKIINEPFPGAGIFFEQRELRNPLVF